MNSSIENGRVVFVAGFVTDGGSGGFEWRTDRAELESSRATWIASGDADVSNITEAKLPANVGHYPDAITRYLEQNADLWEPSEGQNRTSEETK